MTTIRALRWVGSKKAEGWLGRRAAVADFGHVAELAADIARALDTHRDVDANELLARLQARLATVTKAPVFGGKRAA